MRRYRAVVVRNDLSAAAARNLPRGLEEALEFALDAIDHRTEMRTDVMKGLALVEARLDAYRAVLRDPMRDGRRR